LLQLSRVFTKSLHPSALSVEDPYAQQVTAQGIDILYRSLSRVGQVFSLMPITTVWVMWGHIHSALLIGWCVVAYLHIISGLLLVKSYLRQRPVASEAPRWGRYYTIVSFATGVIWGGASLLFFVPDSTPLQVFILVVVVVLSIRSISFHAYWIESYYALLIPTFSLMILGMLRAHDVAYYGLTINLVMGVVILVHVAQNARDEALASIRLRFENLDLVEQLRAEKDKAETANHDKTRFLASASHDLRQPVQALTLFIHALRQELKDGKALVLIDDMGRSIEALNQLLVSLLDISKLDAGIVKPNITHFSLQNLLEVLETEYAPQAKAKGLSFNVTAQGEMIVHSDRTLLETMLRNLISNALRYTNSGGIEVLFKQQAAEVWAEVRDTGIGIAHEQHEDIFREFYQVTNPERDRSKGLGLGLAIVRRLASLLNHRIVLESEFGRGSCFTIVIPAGEHASMASPELLSPYLGQRDIHGLRVLVIDDELAVREGMSAVLEGWGCEVILAASEEEALEKMQNSEPPHAIIADFRLRDGKTGAQAIERLRSQFGMAIPALIVTGDTDPERLREAQASGNVLMHKPTQPGKLRAYLRSVQRRKA